MDRLEETVMLMPALGLGKVEVVAFQEVSCPVGITELTCGQGEDRWHLFAGKQKEEWRGRMIAVKSQFGKIAHKELGEHAIGVCIRRGKGKIGILNVHLPPKATLVETGAYAAAWGDMQASRQQAKILMGDLNETFQPAEGGRQPEDALRHKTARGGLLLQWLSDRDMRAPEQEMAIPTYHPYNPLHQPRRLDYIFTAEIEEVGPGKVHQLRHLVSSDHDALTLGISVTVEGVEDKVRLADVGHGARHLRGQEEVQKMMQQGTKWKGDNLRSLQQVARNITEPKKSPFRYQESKEIKQLRRRAMQQRHTPEARALWKEVWKKKKLHKAEWEREILQEVLRNNWHALQARKRARKPKMWAGTLTAEEGWQKRLKQHFESIFKTQNGKEVSRQVQAIWRKLERQCKEVAWDPFSEEELAFTMGKWKAGKSTGPDGVALEALRALHQDPHWRQAILEEFNDALYKGKLPAPVKESVTVLLPKEPHPKDWSSTRPITLSTSLLKWQSQLILGRAGEHILSGAVWQYAQPGMQPAELILSIRRAIRTCREWRLPLHLIKIDVSKAFDTVSQIQLAALVEQKVGNHGGKPWEARLWIDMLVNSSINVQLENETQKVEQSNGVRQGAPDSPVIFAAIVGQILNEVLGPPARSPNPTPPQPMVITRTEASEGTRPKEDRAPDGGSPMPTNGGGFQDDIYLWSHDKSFLQTKLGILVRSLGAKNLKVNAAKTHYVHTMEGEQTLRVGDREITGERDGTVTVLGAPVALAGEVLQTLAEVARRARVAFAAHKKLLTGAGSVDHKLLAYTRYVSTSALWAIGAAHPHDALLKGMNSIQLMQLRQMLHAKRRPLEQWADWNRRSLRQARACLAARPMHRWSTIALAQVWKLWGHTARHEQHTGLMLGWRSQEWWRAEQSKTHGLRHPHRFNAMLETEKMVEKVAKPWRQHARNREAWKQMEQSFVQRFDPPWSSGKQPSLENLAPN